MFAADYAYKTCVTIKKVMGNNFFSFGDPNAKQNPLS